MPCFPNLTRREFGFALGGLPFASFAKIEDEFRSMPWNGPATVAKVYLSAPTVHWPKPTLDVPAEVAEIETRLGEVARKHTGNVRFTGGDVLQSAEEVRPWLDRMGGIDGILMVPLAQPTPALRALVDEAKVPALFFSRPYATHAWSGIGALTRAGSKIDVLASSSYGDLDPYMRLFKTVHHLKQSKVMVGAATPKGRQEMTEAFHGGYGTTFQFVTGNEFREAFEAADLREARKQTDEFVRNALRVVEPRPQEILNGLRFSVALHTMLAREKANAVTIDCFGTLAARTLPGYPCIAFSKLNDAGLYGVCEGDLQSTLTQMLITSYTGMPGFVSDPVFDTSHNEVIHAHCVSATRMKGLAGTASPYIIRNHLETNEGAVLEVLMPSDETITVARFMGPKRMLVSTAEVTGTVDSDRGCRSKIRTRVSDAEKWLRTYSGGLHRVIFYGDHVRSIERMGRMMGFEVAHEM
ncbi:MAG: hypothetical protein ACKV22_41215 [Bryobacteraceae bacterium]